MSSSGGKSSGQFSFAAPGGNASQSSPGSITGASSADAATVMTMPSTSQMSGEGRIAPLQATSTGSDVRLGQRKESREETHEIYIAENNIEEIAKEGYWKS